MTNMNSGEKEIVFEEATDDLVKSVAPKRQESPMSLWLVKKKLVKNEFQAKMFLIALSLLLFSLSIVIFYFGSLNITPTQLLLPK